MSTIKLSWGTRITVLYLGFVALIVFLVAGSMRQSFDLVSPDYYQKELEYQNVIEAGKNQATLSAPVAIVSSSDFVTISFPNEFRDKVVKGTVQFYSPVNSAWDVTQALEVTNNICNVNRTKLKNSSYKVKIAWESNGKKFYQESEVNLH